MGTPGGVDGKGGNGSTGIVIVRYLSAGSLSYD
jgi:hypothetical protein